ncbi:MAG: hypothetical protein AABZ30_02105 [Myxococcota bacterium]
MKPYADTSRRARAAVTVAAFGMALAFGLYRVGHRDLWIDETFTVVDARRSLADMLAMVRPDGTRMPHTPLAYLVTRATLPFCGDDEACLRLPFVAAYAGVAAVSLRLGWALFGLGAGVCGAALWTLSAYVLKHTHEVRFYSLFALLVLATLAGTVRCLGLDGRPPTARLRTWALTGVAAAAAIWCHVFAALWLVGIAAWAAAYQLVAARRGSAALRGGRLGWAVAAAAFAVAVAPLLPGLLGHFDGDGSRYARFSWKPVKNWVSVAKDVVRTTLKSNIVPALVAAGVVALPGAARARLAAVVAIALFPLVPFTLVTPEHFLTVRYFMPSIALGLLAAGAGMAGLAALPGRLAARAGSGTPARVVAVVLGAAIVAWPAAGIGRLYAKDLRAYWANPGGEPWRQVRDYLRRHARDGDALIVTPYELVRFPFEVYAPPLAPLDDREEDVSRRIDARGFGRVWTIASHYGTPERRERYERLQRRLDGDYRRVGLPSPRIRTGSIQMTLYERRPPAEPDQEPAAPRPRGRRR